MVMRSGLIFVIAALFMAACMLGSPEEDYADFRERTADERMDNACDPSGPPPSTLIDVRGRWILRSLLNGGLAVGLRVDFDDHPDAVASPPLLVSAKIWLWNQPDDATPSVVLERVEITEDGRFQLEAMPLNLGREVINSASPIVADITLNSRGADVDAFCGQAVGQVRVPITLDLEGSTFYAQRNPSGDIQLDEIPFECPDDGCNSQRDGGTMDGGMPDAGPAVRPDSPDLSDLTSQRSDLSGEWAVMASLGGLPVRMWITLDDPSGGSGSGPLIGELRIADDLPGSEARAIFETTVDDEGFFEVWLPGFSLALPTLDVAGDLLLSATTIDAGWCGRGAGQIRSPIELPLEGSTFNAIPWIPGEAFPEDIDPVCPSPSADAGSPQPDAGPMGTDGGMDDGDGGPDESDAGMDEDMAVPSN